MNNYVYFGSDNISCSFLEGIYTKQCIAIITLNDKRSKRGRKLKPSPLALFADKHSIKLIKTDNINSPDIISILKELNPDYFLVFSFGQFLKKSVLSIPKRMAVNLHPSLLPKYRGAAPINRVIMENEKETGISFIKMNEKMDAGPIIIQKKIKLNRDITSKELSSILIKKAINIFNTFDWNNDIQLISQNDNEATFANIIKKKELYYVPEYNALKLNAIINGLSEYGIRAKINSLRVKIFRSKFIENNSINDPGILKIDNKRIILLCKKGSIEIKEIQKPGKRIMRSDEFLNGVKIKTGDKLCAEFVE